MPKVYNWRQIPALKSPEPQHPVGSAMKSEHAAREPLTATSDESTAAPHLSNSPPPNRILRKIPWQLHKSFRRPSTVVVRLSFPVFSLANPEPRPSWRSSAWSRGV